METEETQAFWRVLSSDLTAEQHRWQDEVLEIDSDFSRKGRFESSARLRAITRSYELGIRRFRRSIFQTWTTYVRPRIGTITEGEATRFREIALDFMDRVLKVARDKFSTTNPGQGWEASLMAQIADAARAERQHLESEMVLYNTTPSPVGNVNITTLGAQSPVIVGSGHIHQKQQSAPDVRPLVEALDVLLAALAKKASPELVEVQEVVVEARDEAMKPASNGVRLKSLLSGVRETLGTVTDFQSAWEVVQKVAQSLGLM
jgi:hypothetical protein